MKYLYVFLFVTLSFSLLAQKPLDPERYKEYGLNMTGLISNFIPFNSTKLGIQRYAFSFKYTRRKKRNNKLATLRFALGVDGLADADGGLFNYNLRIGREYKHKLNKSWTFTTGNDFVMFLEPTNQAFKDDFFEDIPHIGVGYGRPFGLEYHINERISLYTETSLQITAGFPPVSVRIVPPTAIFLNVRL